jgi:hypothetical protein
MKRNQRHIEVMKCVLSLYFDSSLIGKRVKVRSVREHDRLLGACARVCLPFI